MLSGPFRGAEARASGLLTRRQLYGPRFRRVFPDVFLPADLVLDLATRSRAAYLLVRDRGGALAGYSAAALLCADCAPPRAPAEVTVPVRTRPHPGLRVHHGLLDAADVVLAGDCRVTAPLRTAWDLARRLPLVEAVVAIDALAHRRAFAPSELLARRVKEPGARNCRRLDRVVALADPRAESPMETRLRLGLIEAGLPPPEVQYEVHDGYGFLLARVDLAYPAVKLAIEYDGAVHFDRRARERDLQRDAELADHGWHTLRLFKEQVAYTMRQTARRVGHLLTTRA